MQRTNEMAELPHGDPQPDAAMQPMEDLPLLLVDDEPDVLRALQRTLQQRDWQLVAASTPEEALVDLDAHEFAAVVCDYRMSGMDGVELLSRVRARWPHTERILLTACANQEALERGINDAGVNRLLRKPWRANVLLSVLDQALVGSRMRREHAVLLERLRNRNDELQYLNRLLEHRVAESDRAITRFRRRWDAALNAISAPLVIVSEALHVEGANVAAGLLSGKSAEELEGRPCHEVLFGRSSCCQGCPLPNSSGRVSASRTGTARTFDVGAYPLPGDSPAFLCTYVDVTEKLSFERETAHVEKMAAIGRLAGSVAHELNNPLHAILTFVQLAQKPAVPDEKLTRYHEVIRESAIRCRDIVLSLRNFSRRESASDGRLVDLHQVCDKALVLFSTLRGDKRVERTAAGTVDAYCLGNANQFQQVLVNLIQNAVDASPEGGVIRVSVEQENDQLVVAVEDQGSGVPESERHKIFEPFYTTKPEGVGTGLGLAISHQILREHGGASDRVNVFTSRLPRDHPPTGGFSEGAFFLSLCIGSSFPARTIPSQFPTPLRFLISVIIGFFREKRVIRSSFERRGRRSTRTSRNFTERKSVVSKPGGF